MTVTDDQLFIGIKVPADWVAAIDHQASAKRLSRSAFVRELMVAGANTHMPDVALTPHRTIYRPVAAAVDDVTRLHITKIYAAGYSIDNTSGIAGLSYDTVWSVLTDAGVQMHGRGQQSPMPADHVRLLLSSTGTEADVVTATTGLPPETVQWWREVNPA